MREHGRSARPPRRCHHRHEDHVGLAQLPDRLDRDQLRVARTDADADEPHAARSSPGDGTQREPAAGLPGPVQVQVGGGTPAAAKPSGGAIGERDAGGGAGAGVQQVRWNSCAVVTGCRAAGVATASR